jgi:hypothetical protein
VVAFDLPVLMILSVLPTTSRIHGKRIGLICRGWEDRITWEGCGISNLFFANRELRGIYQVLFLANDIVAVRFFSD